VVVFCVPTVSDVVPKEAFVALNVPTFWVVTLSVVMLLVVTFWVTTFSELVVIVVELISGVDMLVADNDTVEREGTVSVVTVIAGTDILSALSVVTFSVVVFIVVTFSVVTLPVVALIIGAVIPDAVRVVVPIVVVVNASLDKLVAVISVTFIDVTTELSTF
jgi:hypothetical protein